MVVRYNCQQQDYINNETPIKSVSQLPAVERLTPENKQFLKTLGFRVIDSSSSSSSSRKNWREKTFGLPLN